MTGSGEAIAVWKRLINPPGVYEIQAALRPSGGAFGSPITAAQMPAGVIPNGLQIAVNDAGDVAVVWTQTEPGSAIDKAATVVKASVMQAGGGFSEAVRVSPPIEPPIEEPTEPPTFLHLNAVEPSVAIDPAGDAVVAWRYFDGTDQVIEAAERPAAGSFSVPDGLSSSGVNSFEPEVAMDGAGEAIAVWEEEGTTQTVVNAAFKPVGDDFESPVPISEAGKSSIGPKIAMTAAGFATVVWTRDEEEGSTIQASNRPAGGSFSAPEVVTPTPEGRSAPVDTDLKMNDAGDAVVAWPGRSANGSEPLVKAATRTGTGSFTAPVEVSATSPDFLHPDVAIDAEGNATVIWARTDGANLIAQAAGYDASPPEMRGLSVPPTGTVGVPVTFSASPFDVWPLKSTEFTFGDGLGAPGTAALHSYSAPGVYTVTRPQWTPPARRSRRAGRSRSRPPTSSRIGKQNRNKKKGTATLTVEVSGPGQVPVSGKKVKGKSKRAAAAGSVTRPDRGQGQGAEAAAKEGKGEDPSHRRLHPGRRRSCRHQRRLGHPQEEVAAARIGPNRLRRRVPEGPDSQPRRDRDPRRPDPEGDGDRLGRRLLGDRPRRAPRARGRRGVPDRPGGPGRELPRTSRRSSRRRKEAGAEAIHPGYGFLAENAEFARACAEAGIVFIGPPPEAIEAMGSKTRAREIMAEAGVPIVPGATEPAKDVEAARKQAEEAGYPVACKAAGGGGGKGFRVAMTPDDLEEAFEGAGPRRREVLLRRPRLRRALPRGPAPRRGPGAGRLARQRDPPRRARLLDPAPPPEGDRGGARARTSTPRCASGSARSPPTRPPRSATAAPARSRGCRSARSTSSSR